MQAFDSPLDQPVIDAMQKVAEDRGVTMAQVALAWVLRHPVVCAPSSVPRSPHHLPEAVAAVDIQLTLAEARVMEEPYTQHGGSWF